MNRSTNWRMIVFSWKTSNWRIETYSNLVRLTGLLLRMIFRQILYFLTAALIFVNSSWKFLHNQDESFEFESDLHLFEWEWFSCEDEIIRQKREWATECKIIDFTSRKCCQIFVQCFSHLMTNEAHFYMRVFLQNLKIIVSYEDFEYDYFIMQLLRFRFWRRLIHRLIQLLIYLISSLSEIITIEIEIEITLMREDETTYISRLWIEDMTRKIVRKREKELRDCTTHDEDYKVK